jgi:hypothetical protein
MLTVQCCVSVLDFKILWERLPSFGPSAKSPQGLLACSVYLPCRKIFWEGKWWTSSSSSTFFCNVYSYFAEVGCGPVGTSSAFWAESDSTAANICICISIVFCCNGFFRSSGPAFSLQCFGEAPCFLNTSLWCCLQTMLQDPAIRA